MYWPFYTACTPGLFITSSHALMHTAGRLLTMVARSLGTRPVFDILGLYLESRSLFVVQKAVNSHLEISSSFWKLIWILEYRSSFGIYRSCFSICSEFLIAISLSKYWVSVREVCKYQFQDAVRTSILPWPMCDTIRLHKTTDRGRGDQHQVKSAWNSIFVDIYDAPCFLAACLHRLEADHPTASAACRQ